MQVLLVELVQNVSVDPIFVSYKDVSSSVHGLTFTTFPDFDVIQKLEPKHYVSSRETKSEKLHACCVVLLRLICLLG